LWVTCLSCRDVHLPPPCSRRRFKGAHAKRGSRLQTCRALPLTRRRPLFPRRSLLVPYGPRPFPSSPDASVSQPRQTCKPPLRPAGCRTVTRFFPCIFYYRSSKISQS
jgi:hypothetical protein